MSCRYLSLTVLATALAVAAPINEFVQTNLVSSVSGLAQLTDPDLRNPWGVAFSPTSPFWIADQGSNKATLYNGNAVKQGLVVNVGGGPTGMVFNSTSAFNGDLFIFAGLDGDIRGWRGALGTNAEVLSINSDSVYTGLAIGSIGSDTYLYAANFAQAKIDVFGSIGAPSLSSFTDPNLPAGYAPFGVETIGSQVFVTFAKVDPVTHKAEPGAGNGFVDIFNLNGTFVKRVASRGALNAPWGLAVAPAGFGTLGGDLLVGNFGDGTINAFDANGNFLGVLANLQGSPLINTGLWALKFGNSGVGFNPFSLYVTAGINDEHDGLFARIDTAAAVPEPGTFAMVGLALALVTRRALKVS